MENRSVVLGDLGLVVSALMFVEAAGGVLVCGSLASAGSVVLRRHHQVASGLFALALACAAAQSFGAPDALHAVACVLGSLAVLALVIGRFGRPQPLSWLDFAMGGCAVGALAVTTGAEVPATLAAIGVAAALGLARWRVS